MSENAEQKLGYRDQHGRHRTLTVRHGTAPTPTGSGILARSLTSDDGVTVVKKWLPADVVSEQAWLCDLLENEARAGMRLAGRFPVDYPAEVTHLIGYDLDGEEPFVLLAPARGKPLAAAHQLLVDEQLRFQVSLLKGLLILAEAGTVHGNLSPTTVRWDGVAVQIGDFFHSAAVGDARPLRSLRSSPMGSAAGVRQPTTSTVTTGDDVWAVGLLILHQATGSTDHADLANRGPALRALLEDVFTEPAHRRPTAAVLLRRLGTAPQLPARDEHMARTIAEGQRMFDRVLAEKWPTSNRPAPPMPSMPPSATPMPSRPPRRPAADRPTGRPLPPEPTKPASASSGGLVTPARIVLFLIVALLALIVVVLVLP